MDKMLYKKRIAVDTAPFISRIMDLMRRASRRIEKRRTLPCVT